MTLRGVRYDTARSHAFILLLFTNRIFVCIVSFDSDEIETSSFFLSVKHTLGLNFIQKHYPFYIYTF